MPEAAPAYETEPASEEADWEVRPGPLTTVQRDLRRQFGVICGACALLCLLSAGAWIGLFLHRAKDPDLLPFGPDESRLDARPWTTGWNTAFRVQRTAAVTLAKHTVVSTADAKLQRGYLVRMVRRHARVSWPATGSMTVDHHGYAPSCVYQTRSYVEYADAPPDAVSVDLRIPRPKSGWPVATIGTAAIHDGEFASSEVVRRYPSTFDDIPLHVFSEHWYNTPATDDSDYHGKTPGAGDWWILHAAHASDFARVTALTGDPWSLERWPDWALVAWPAHGPRPGVVIGGRRIDLGDARALARYGITARHVPPVHGLTP